MTELTDKQKDILNFLRKFTAENGYPPTVKEVMAKFNFASPTAVTTHLIALEKKGFVKKTGNRARGSVPVNILKNNDTINIPLLSNEMKSGLLMDLVNPDNIELNNGDIVAAKIDNKGNEEITIKRFFKENDSIKLISENINYPTIEKEKISIIGKVVGLIRLRI